MKNLRNFFVILFTLSMCINFSSCNKEDKEDDKTDTQIVGTWSLYKYTWPEDGKTQSETSENEIFYTFNSDGTGILYCDGKLYFRWSIKGDALFLEYSDDEDDCLYIITIEKLTKDELILKYPDYWADLKDYREFFKSCK